jgi:hypothetical protein
VKCDWIACNRRLSFEERYILARLIRLGALKAKRKS